MMLPMKNCHGGLRSWPRFVAGLLWALALPAWGQSVLVKPYVQPGEQAEVGTADSKVIAWITDNVPGEFVVEYAVPERRAAKPSRYLVQTAAQPAARHGKAKKPTPALAAREWLHYRADLKDLPLGGKITYRVQQGGKEIAAGAFTARKPPAGALDFVIFGDNAEGYAAQRKIAYQMHRCTPEMVLNVGDNVYDNGTIGQYEEYFWPDYVNTEEASPLRGAPLLRSAPFYMVLGNHDVHGANLGWYPDGMASFLFFYYPLNGPELTRMPPLTGPADRVAKFKAAAGPRWPRMGQYSFDNGPAHFVMLDANRYMSTADKAWRDWLAADLAASKLPWKFVLFHQPPFALSAKHGRETHMRALTDIFQAGGVQLVFCGHVHNYQRTKPLTYDAAGRSDKARDLGARLALDETFDGKTATAAKGIIYVVTGGGGSDLEDYHVTNEPAKWPRHLANYVADRHSFTRVELTPEKCRVRQIDSEGRAFDEFTVTRK